MESFSIPLLASCLQRLKDPIVQPEVVKAVTNQDVHAFEAACLNAHIPRQMIARITRLVFSVDPNQGWPPMWG